MSDAVNVDVVSKDEIQHLALEKPKEVAAIFEEFFGEDLVDFQPNTERINSLLSSRDPVYLEDINRIGHRIIVKFPKVTVTNELDNSIEIDDLYVKVLVSSNGYLTGTFTMARGVFTKSQWDAGYIHSHARFTINEFAHVCLGTGPLNSTCCTLNTVYDLDIWNLFCRELSLYVTVESLEGVPYIRLENVNKKDGTWTRISSLPSAPLKSRLQIILGRELYLEFLKGIFHNNILRYSCTNVFDIGMSPKDVIVKISKYFTAWFNECVAHNKLNLSFSSLLEEKIIYPCKLDNSGDLSIPCAATRSPRNPPSPIEFFSFKGEGIKIRIIEDSVEPTFEYPYILDIKELSFITSNILKLVNYEYASYDAIERLSSRERDNGTLYFYHPFDKRYLFL